MNADIFLERAKQLSDVRNLLQGEPAYASATALLAVHAAIAFNDAVLIRLTGKRGGGESHLNAVQMTIRACRTRKINNRGAEHLKMLLSSKTQISYGNEAVSLEIATRLSLASERFQFWAYSVLGGRP